MEDNGLKPHWTNELKRKYKELPKIAVSIIKEVLN